MCLAEIKHYHFISERLASSGQPSAEQLNDIATAGFQVVINLAMADSKNAISNEDSLVTSLGMVYVHQPVPFDAPTIGHLQTFFEAMREHENKKVWVHCALNYRVSAFLYHYHRMVLNQSDAQAKQVILPGWQPNAVWQQFLSLSKNAVML